MLSVTESYGTLRNRGYNPLGCFKKRDSMVSPRQACYLWTVNHFLVEGRIAEGMLSSLERYNRSSSRRSGLLFLDGKNSPNGNKDNHGTKPDSSAPLTGQDVEAANNSIRVLEETKPVVFLANQTGILPPTARAVALASGAAPAKIRPKTSPGTHLQPLRHQHSVVIEEEDDEDIEGWALASPANHSPNNNRMEGNMNLPGKPLSATRLPPVNKNNKITESSKVVTSPELRKRKDSPAKNGKKMSPVMSPENSRMPRPKKARQLREDPTDKENPFWFIQLVKRNPTTNEFVYLIPIDKDTAEHNPYNLKIVPHSMVDNNDFYTMSAQGVTHIINGVAALDQWVHEYHLFKKIIQIPLFHHYKMWKSYFTWRKNVCSRRMHHNQTVLVSQLFLCNKQLSSSLLRLRDVCQNIIKLRLYQVEPGKVYTMNEFVEAQNNHREKIHEKLEQHFNELKAIVLRACEESLVANGFFGGEQDYEEEDHTDLTPTRSPSSKRWNSFPNSQSNREARAVGLMPKNPAIKENNPLHYTQLAAKRTECRRLTSFIRLSDYLLIDALHSLALSSATDLLSIFTESNNFVPKQGGLVQSDGWADFQLKKSPHPSLRIDVGFSVNAMKFTPNLHGFISTISTIISCFTDTVVSVPKLIAHPEFKQFTQPTISEHYEYSDIGEGLDLNTIIDDDEAFSTVVSSIKDRLTQAFGAVTQYSQSFSPYVDMYIENQNLDLNAIRVNKEIPLTYFKESITKYKSQIHLMKQMPLYSQVGMTVVDSVHLKELLSPSPKRCLEEIQRLIPELARMKNEELLSDLNTAMRTLTSNPQTVEEFVDYLEFLGHITDAQEEISSRFNAVTDMYAMMDEYQVTIPDEEFALYQTLKPVYEKLKEVVASSESNKDDKMNKFVIQLEQSIEKLRSGILQVRTQAQHPMVSNPASDIYDVQEYLNALFAKIEEWKALAEKYAKYQDMFKVELAQFDDLEETWRDLDLKRTLWQSLSEWMVMQEEWNNAPFETIDAESINLKVQSYTKTAFLVQRGLPYNLVVLKFKETVDEFKVFLPVLLDLRNQSLKARHWEQIQDVIGQRIVRDKNFTLGVLVDLKVVEYKEEINIISSSATNEALLEEMLRKIEHTWDHTEFTVVQPRESKDFQEALYIISGVDEIIIMLEDSQVTITTIRGSRHAGPFKSQVEMWDRQLAIFAETLDEWMTCQRNWLYLESIFGATDIQRQMPAEYKIFALVDKSWKDLMRKTKDNPNAIRATTAHGVLEMLQNNNVQLEKIQKSLEDYLETKRLAFARFYFLSNDELLEILAQTKNPHAVQPHLKKCFDNITKLEFTSEPRSVDIIAMISGEGERVELGKLKARGTVETWLTGVEQGMVQSLRRLTKQATLEYDRKPRTEWILDFPAQVILTASQIAWCNQVTACLNSDDPREALESLKELSIHQLSQLAELVRGELTPLKRGVIGALITIDVHARNILDDLIQKNVRSETDFGWTQQLRYYWSVEADDCMVVQNSFHQAYGYEYLGCTQRLVLTPLTDRCYMTLTGALHLHCGGAPSGPAGTGKTETVKDLAKALGKQCVVFNCSEGLDYQMMGQFFSGLVQAGAWCCFDEFNRIDIEVLSVIAQQILTIKTALASRLLRFNFEGREIRMNNTCGFFITMNPGYAGRTELPDNLKSLFRPVSMMIPDYALIAEIILFSEGFKSANILSRKMIQLYKLSSEQLSKQDHYDFGMRAIKSVLVMAGSLKRGNPDLREDIVLIRSLRDSNIPKFLAEDIPLFQGILGDLFPGVDLPDVDYGRLASAIPTALISMGLQPVPALITKIIQLYETMTVRHGVMLVGKTGCGKTTCYRALAEAMGELKTKDVHDPTYQKVNIFALNPKSIDIGELYGEFNKFTHEWTVSERDASGTEGGSQEGIAANIVRKCVADSSPVHKWVVFDGPVDALWIENMNTVLDDNKMLCLNNGQRIKLTSSMHLIFEVEDLRVASPATVSRCGMVFIQPEVVGWRPLVLSWINAMPSHIPQNIRDHIYSLFDLYVDTGLHCVRTQCKEIISSVDVNLVSSLMHLFTSMFDEESGVNFKDEFEDLKHVVNLIFVFCYVWSIGGNIEVSSQDIFDSYAREQFESLVPIPGTQTIYYYYVDMQSKALAKWSDQVPDFQYDPKIPYFQMIVPTVDSVRYTFLMNRLMKVNRPVLFSGGTGVGKTSIITDQLFHGNHNGSIIPVTINFTARTSSKRTQELFESKLEKKRKTLLGAPVGKKVVLFIDDINMPQLDTYGASPPIELLRQYLDMNGFYDRYKLFWKDVQDVYLIAACGEPGGGRNPMTPRFLRHFNMLALPTPSEDSLQRIFGSIMKGFLENGNFNEEIQGFGKKIVNASVDLYTRICKELLPTPAKSHYTFNLRDLSKVFQGVLQVKRTSVNNIQGMARLWIHEAMRVFHDRLIDNDDRLYFTQLICELIRRHFDLPWTHQSLFEATRPIMFGDYMRHGFDSLYEEITDYDKLLNTLDNYLEGYNINSTSNSMKLIFFKDAVEHLSRISRIIRQPRGNALLVGIEGCGKRSLTRLACHMADYTYFQIELNKNYGTSEFRDDLKKLYHTAGVQGTPVVFSLSDSHIAQESFLEDVNNVLNSGEVPNLFEPDEYEKILNLMTPVAKSAGIPEQRDLIFSYFIRRVQENLHIVISMSPVGDNFRRRCRMFPSLVNCCTIDWFSEWPAEALLAVSTQFLVNVELGSAETKEKISEMCVSVHQQVTEMAERYYGEVRRRFYTTPSGYLELINLFVIMLEKKRHEFDSNRGKLSKGLEQLGKTNEVVTEMQSKLSNLQPELEYKAIENEKLLERIKQEQTTADAVKKVVMQEEAEVKKQTTEIEALADEAKRDLDEAIPALDAAVRALNALNKTDISEVKSFPKPPELVSFVMEAVCVLLQAPDTKWQTAKTILSDPKFLTRLINYDKDHIPENVLKRLRKYTENPQFEPNAVAKHSAAAKSICMWVRAMEMYSKIFKAVEPKRQRVEEASAMLEASQSKLAEKQERLHDIEEKLAGLKRSYEKSIADKSKLQDTISITSTRLERASKITEGLSGEQVRWAQTLQTLDSQKNHIVGNTFIAAACVAYAGVFTMNYRQELEKMWSTLCRSNNIPISSDFSLQNVLSDPVQVRDWQVWGLPSDNLSVDNAILATNGRRWPLMIDPQGQANRWIRNMESRNSLKILKPSEPNFMRTLEGAIRTGQPVLIEELGELLDPSLEPVLMRQTFKQGGRHMLRLGDVDVDYDKNFRLYMTTKLPNPHFLPNVCIRTMIINFTVTMRGLEDQLLGEVVAKERPEVEEKRNGLVLGLSADKKQLKDIEDKILKVIYQAEGNILNDEVLINTLNEAKTTSSIITVRVAEAEDTEKKINALRETYRSVAVRGSILYFCTADMGTIDSMYQYSLSYFSSLYNSVIDSTAKSTNLEKRLSALTLNMTRTIFYSVSRGLFEEHKLLYAFSICSQILKSSGDITQDEWNAFLRGPQQMMTEEKEESDIEGPSWMTSQAWDALGIYEKNIAGFEGIRQHILGHAKEWSDIFKNSTEPHKEPLPGRYNTSLSSFRHLLLIKTLREEKMVFAMTEFVDKSLGKEFVDPPPLDLAAAFRGTSPTIPLIFVLSQGADPTGSLLRLAKERNWEERLHIVSLGQGQGPHASALIDRATKTGDWVLLQNCHLAISWMPALEKIVQQLADSDVHPDFRLILSSMPSQKFPVSILQNGVKITSEPPKGLKANLARSFADFTEAWYEESMSKLPWKKLLFGLCFFHAMIQERKKYGALGWNVKYEFNQSDLEVASETLRMYLQDGNPTPWEALLHLTGDIFYGGRVTDEWDRRCLKAILNRFYSPQILDDSYLFSPSGIYKAPVEGSLTATRNYIDKLPLADSPEIFGLDDNANITYQINESQKVMGQLLSTQPRLVNMTGKTSDQELVAQLAKKIIEGLPSPLNLSREDMHESLLVQNSNGALSSYTTVLLQESARFNRLLSIIRESMIQLGQAVQGLLVMSASLEKVFSSLLDNQVPDVWQKEAYASRHVLSDWIVDLTRRVSFFRNWMSNGQPAAFWLPGFFYPQSFLSAVLQSHARKHNLPIDSLNFDYEVVDCPVGELTPPEDGTYIWGLFLEGAQWKDGQLSEAGPGDMYSQMPPLHLIPKQNHTHPSTGHYLCPIYRTPERAGALLTTGHSTNYITAATLKTDVDPDYWILKGTALLCQIPGLDLPRQKTNKK
ncbi:dynein heavy chain 6, axonemal-like [Planoprotostelium fungivorum]|uniref:Dynein heavy chain 6, axonemal-like n=1 Tax=Planoprotostelium fungivorum TaxID=1890364 RepID=A0A2P6NVR0_9EUKA|nr:dynein heavy chain 6, axonemal-like [Planoprotostelium fungivorum]